MTQQVRIHLQCRRPNRRRFNPWIRKICWNRKWEPTPVFLLGKFHEQGSLAGYSPRGHKESGKTQHIALLQSYPIASYLLESIQWCSSKCLITSSLKKYRHICMHISLLWILPIWMIYNNICIIQLLSCVWLFATSWITARLQNTLLQISYCQLILVEYFCWYFPESNISITSL